MTNVRSFLSFLEKRQKRPHSFLSTKLATAIGSEEGTREVSESVHFWDEWREKKCVKTERRERLQVFFRLLSPPLFSLLSCFASAPLQTPPESERTQKGHIALAHKSSRRLGVFPIDTGAFPTHVCIHFFCRVHRRRKEGKRGYQNGGGIGKKTRESDDPSWFP